MLLHLFRDVASEDVFAFSSDPAGRNLPPVTAHTRWQFVETIDTLKFPDPWNIDDFEDVLEHLYADGFYLFEGELIEAAARSEPRPAHFTRH
jgi:hypothetical protein